MKEENSQKKMRHLIRRKEILVFLVSFCVLIFWFWHTDVDSPRTREPVGPVCYPGYVANKVAALISNYSRDPPVFLQLSDYFWVKNHTLYQLPYGTAGSEALMMTFLTLVNNYHIPPEIERLPCKRCVVVGNGFRLKNSSLGEVINSYDIVIRLNNAPVHQYQQDVGNKTTMRLFYPESAKFNQRLDVNPDSLMVLVPFKPLDIQWMKIIINNEKRNYAEHPKMPRIIWQLGTENVRVLNPYFMNVAATKLLNRKQKKIRVKPTTGMLAITFALHFCDLVHIAGFGYPVSSNKKQPVHYYNSATLNNVAKAHNVLLEANVIKTFLQHRVIHNLTHY